MLDFSLISCIDNTASRCTNQMKQLDKCQEGVLSLPLPLLIYYSFMIEVGRVSWLSSVVLVNLYLTMVCQIMGASKLMIWSAPSVSGWVSLPLSRWHRTTEHSPRCPQRLIAKQGIPHLTLVLMQWEKKTPHEFTKMMQCRRLRS